MKKSANPAIAANPAILTYSRAPSLGYKGATLFTTEVAVQRSMRSMHFDDMVRFRAEHGLAEAVTEAARRNRTTSSEYLRHAVRAKLVADGVQLPPLANSNLPGGKL